MTTQLKSFIDVAPDSDFPIQNLPYGIFSETADGKRRAGVALGEYVVDLAVLEQAGLLTIEAGRNYFDQSTLNQFIESGRDQWTQVRSTLQLLLSSTNPELRDNSELREKAFFKRSEVVLHLPVHIPGYTDFYSSKEHATNVGCMFRDPKNALLPNWSELPVGYNGRASSVVVSGTDIVRPSGGLNCQVKNALYSLPVASSTLNWKPVLLLANQTSWANRSPLKMHGTIFLEWYCLMTGQHVIFSNGNMYHLVHLMPKRLLPLFHRGLSR